MQQLVKMAQPSLTMFDTEPDPYLYDDNGEIQAITQTPRRVRAVRNLLPALSFQRPSRREPSPEVDLANQLPRWMLEESGSGTLSSGSGSSRTTTPSSASANSTPTQPGVDDSPDNCKLAA